MDSENESTPKKKTEEVKSGPTTMDSRILILLVVVVILLLSNIVTAYMAFMDDDEDEHDDDDNGHSNGNGHETRTPVIENLSVKNASKLIQSMEGNASFTIIDVRTMEEFDDGHIPDSLNFNFWDESFEPTISILDKNLSYLIYCKSGGRSGLARDQMMDLGFMEIYNMIGGFNAWKGAGYEYDVTPVIPREQNFANITVSESRDLIESNMNNTRFVILDVRRPEEYVEGHLNNSINLDFWDESFEDMLEVLDKNLTYLVYCKSGGRSGMARDMMHSLMFYEVTNMLGGFDEWKIAGYEYRVTPVIPKVQNFANLSVHDSYNLTQDNINNSHFVILDVRTPEEYAEGHLNSSINLDFWDESFEDMLEILDKNLTYLVYCKSGGRSGMARDTMHSLMFYEVTNMLGGFDEWEREGYPYKT